MVLFLFLFVAVLSGYWLHRHAGVQSAPIDSGLLLPRETSTKRDADPVDSLVREANGFLMLRDCKNAIPLMQQVLRQRPDPEAWVLLGKCLLDSQRGAEAYQAFTEAQKRGSNNSRLGEWLAKAQKLQQEDQEMGRLESAHFELWVEGKGTTWEAADTLLPELEKAFDQLCLAWNHYPHQKLAVVFYEDPRFRGNDVPAWSRAEFDGKIRIPYGILQEWPRNRRILVHELSHAFVRDIAGSSLVAWLDEGLAQHFDGTPYQAERLAELGIAPMELLTQSFSAQVQEADAHRLYLTSHGMFLILLQAADGRLQEIKSMLQSLQEGVPLEEQLSARFDLSLEKLHQRLSATLPPPHDTTP